MDISDVAQQLLGVRENAKMLKERETELKNQLKKYLKEEGIEDASGNVYIEIEDKNCRVSRIVHSRRVSKVLDSEIAAELLTEKDLFDTCVTTIQVLDEEEIMKAFYEDKLTEEDIDRMFPESVVWAVNIEKRND